MLAPHLTVGPFMFGILTPRRQLSKQHRKGSLHGIPYHIEIDVEIAVSDSITHAAHTAPWDMGVSLGKLGEAVHHFRRRLADDAHVLLGLEDAPKALPEHGVVVAE
jgi:hypothetical protein